LSLLTIPKAKRTKRTGGKTPEEVISPDNNDTPEDPDDDAFDEDSTQIKVQITVVMQVMYQDQMSVLGPTMILVRILMKGS
jgi:hypothetical protein